MASENLRQRSKDEPDISTTTTNNNNSSSSSTTTTTTIIRRDKRMAMAKRGLRSLTIAIAIPLCLTAATTFLCGGPTRAYPADARPFWHPPRWLVHMTSLSTTTLMGLAAWLVWADGGFRRQPAALPLYLAQLLLGLLWAPLVFRVGAMKGGLGVCFLLLLALFGCGRTFRKVNPIAAGLVKPCLAWVSFLAIFNYKLT